MRACVGVCTFAAVHVWRTTCRIHVAPLTIGVLGTLWQAPSPTETSPWPRLEIFKKSNQLFYPLALDVTYSHNGGVVFVTSVLLNFQNFPQTVDHSFICGHVGVVYWSIVYKQLWTRESDVVLLRWYSGRCRRQEVGLSKIWEQSGRYSGLAGVEKGNLNHSPATGLVKLCGIGPMAFPNLSIPLSKGKCRSTSYPGHVPILRLTGLCLFKNGCLKSPGCASWEAGFTDTLACAVWSTGLGVSPNQDTGNAMQPFHMSLARG